MKELMRLIYNDENIGKGAPVDANKLALANVELKSKGFCTIPENFAGMLKIFNGVSSYGNRIFGVNPQSNFFDDLVKYNERANMEDKAENLILGADEFDYLVYNNQKSKYQLIDKEDYEIKDESADLADAVARILKI